MGDNRESESFYARLPGGINLTAKGKDLIVFILFVLLFVYITYINYLSSQDHNLIARELRINTYILSLPQDKRPELVPPREVWERMRRKKDFSE